MTSSWTWEYSGYDPKQERLREALCTLGNGRFATRGAAPETDAGPVHYPATYGAGCYNRLESLVAGRRIVNEDLVNLPNWLPLRYRCRPADGPPGDWLTPDHASLRRYHLTLDLRSGVLTRHLLYQDGYGRRLGVTHARLVHMGDPYLAAQRTTLRAYGWQGEIEVESALDGDVVNAGVDRYRELANRHLTGLRSGVDRSGALWLSCRATDGLLQAAMALRTAVRPLAAVSTWFSGGRAAQSCIVPISRQRHVTVVKTAALHTTVDGPAGELVRDALDSVTQAPGFAALLTSHRQAWDRLWQRAELSVPGEAGRVLRLHMFHVLQTLSPNTAALDVGVPARGLHGEAYRGHVFWDELFVLPYLSLHFPQVARALLGYRHRRLPAACESARKAGHQGAMYPWQSGRDGREESQEVHLNPRSGHWMPDHSRLQRHVGSAIALNVWRYAQTSGDTEFLHGPGAEMLLQIARFWEGAADYDPSLARWRIRGVVGPDEFHDAYPGADRPGLDDNAYTNVTASWVLARAAALAAALPEARRSELFEQLGAEPDVLERWEAVSRGLHVPFHQGVISQFEGYGELAELDWDAYRARYADIRRLDRILEAEGDTVNRYQASKQADTLMLGHLFSPAQLAELFSRLGYVLDDETWRRTVAYYLRRTSHGSTLSSLVHGWVLTRLGGADAWRYCEEALLSDVADVQGGTTAEGIHLGAMAGTVDLVQRGLTGLETGPDGLRLHPVPLDEISRFVFSLCYRGHRGIQVRMLPGRLGIFVPPSRAGPLTVILPDDRHVVLNPGERHWYRLPRTES
ncbi:glycoside hydrolase family 65 protein [Streptomyces sp. PR69]|uniref:glycoside hydrolase family 65 protein n=1 Tax=Streptomyces sp. PR69 TaxID=2984950 RepID=UPI00226530E8|nr:glycosyl hydrolase family 65 protein [Streptomyces sp. PR69]